jgi:hypothetical protein
MNAKKLTVTLQDTECDRYKRMFEAACVALGEIGDALGCDPNEGGSEPILDAIEALKEAAEVTVLTVESAHAMGAKGATPTESERELFEAWMRGHGWGYSDTWTGATYQDRDVYREEKCLDPLAMQTRQLWAAWRDRAALSSPTCRVDFHTEIAVHENINSTC